MTKREIEQMDRKELVEYLTGWGFQCYDNETLGDLRKAALENWRTEKQ